MQKDVKIQIIIYLYFINKTQRMTSNIRATTTINAEVVPPSTMETVVLDQSEKEYDKMISQNAIYHKTMMEDLIKLSSESGSGSGSNGDDKLDMIFGLMHTIDAIDQTNSKLMTSAQNKLNHGSQNASVSPILNSDINETKNKLIDTVNKYDELMKMKREGFENPTIDAALGNSAVVYESQKYALVLFGVCAIYLLYKTAKYL